MKKLLATSERRLARLATWQLVALTMLGANGVTAAVTLMQTWIWWDYPLGGVLLIGMVDASIAAGLIAPFLIRRVRSVEEKEAESTVGKRYQHVFENSPVGIYRTTPTGEIVFANPALLRLLKYQSFEELKNRNLETEGFEPEYPRSEFIRRIETEGSVVGLESAWKRRDGSVIHVRENARAFREADGRVIYYEGAVEDITEKKEAEEELRRSLNEKEVLLKEIHHRVKNNMQVISSLLNLQMGHLKDESARTAFRESQDRVRSMALVHESLYRSSSLASIPFTRYLQELVRRLAVSHDKRHIKIGVPEEPVEMSIDLAIPLGLIVNELVTNAFKHGFDGREGGEVHVTLAPREEGAFELRVVDDGVGFPRDLDFHETTTLGLQLVVTLVAQIGGTIEVEREGGTAFTIRFGKEPQGPAEARPRT